jgi:hypothetical protein
MHCFTKVLTLTYFFAPAQAALSTTDIDTALRPWLLPVEVDGLLDVVPDVESSLARGSGSPDEMIHGGDSLQKRAS